MNTKTVKKQIFWSNTLMVCVTLVAFLAINLLVIKLYGELIEKEFLLSLDAAADSSELKAFLAEWTVRRNGFLLLFAADGVLCILLLVGISQLFTKHLTARIMEPLTALEEGAKRIRENDLTTDIVYSGDVEFERVCDAFNDMQHHIHDEQEKNRKYEKARTDMTAGISHDLRTPLTAIRGTIKAILDGVVKTPAQTEAFLQTAYRRTGEMDSLLNQLLFFSKVETGNLPVNVRPVEIGAFTKSFVGIRQENAKENETITVQCSQPLTVMADVEQLGRIFDNLIENSRKYAKANPLRIQISIAAQANQTHAQICFADNGVGVEAEKLSHLFEEFYRADESRTKEGNGLGLYIVRYLVRQMGGEAWAENASDGKGFCVHVTLPLAE